MRKWSTDGMTIISSGKSKYLGKNLPRCHKKSCMDCPEIEPAPLGDYLPEL
jgi:hypothetical protein